MAARPTVIPNFSTTFPEPARVNVYRIAPNGTNPKMLIRKSASNMFPKTHVLSAIEAEEKSKGERVKAPR